MPLERSLQLAKSNLGRETLWESSQLSPLASVLVGSALAVAYGREALLAKELALAFPRGASLLLGRESSLTSLPHFQRHIPLPCAHFIAPPFDAQQSADGPPRDALVELKNAVILVAIA